MRPTKVTEPKRVGDLVMSAWSETYQRRVVDFLQTTGSTQCYNVGQTLKVVDDSEAADEYAGVFSPANGSTCHAILLENIRAASGALVRANVLYWGPAVLNQNALEFDPAADVEAQISSLKNMEVVQIVPSVSEPENTTTAGE